MPYVNIKIAGTATSEQKQELIKETTKLVSSVLNKKPSATYVVVDEISTDNWGVGGDSLTNIRKKASSND